METSTRRKLVPLPWLEKYNLRHRKPEELESLLIRFEFRDGRVEEHLTHNVMIRGSLSTHRRLESTEFLLVGHPSDREYTEEGYRVHTYREE